MVEFNPGSQEFRDDRSGVFRAMRDETPVYQSPDGTFVALSRYDDVIAAALDWETYSSAQFGENPPLEILNLFDPPVHSDLKARLSAAYSPQRILALEPEIRSRAQSLIEEMKANDSGDLIHQFIRPLMTSVMGLLLGMTDEQIALCQRLTDATLLTGPDVNQFAPLIQDIVAHHQGGAGDDLMTALLSLEGEGAEALSESALLGFCWGIILGNNCTAMDSIANGIGLLAQSPNQWRELAADPSLIPQAFEEMMRCEPPTHNSPRVTTKEVELHGVTIPAGTSVLLMWGAANLDERKFENPDRFDIHRQGEHQLSLGWGTHLCIGDALARLEARVVFEELVAAFPEVTVAGTPERIPSAWQWGFETLVLEFTR
jgi:cytochrome P450